MKCEICQINDASVHFKQVQEGEARELYVCEQCAAQNGFDPGSPMALTDFLFGVGVQAETVPPDDRKKCHSCGMGWKEFNKKSRLGCQSCYEDFATELAPMIEAMQNGLRHVGKVPACAVMDVELESLQAALDRAVGLEDFEEAAILRDRMRDLSGRETV
jgi:protein arginine kinase activator